VQERLSIGLIGDAKRVHHAEAIAPAERMTIQGADDRVLLVGGQRGQRVRDRGPDRPSREPLGRALAQMSCQREAALDPFGLAPEQPRDRGRRLAVLVDEGCDDPGLVQRGDCAVGRVGSEDEALVLGGVIAGALDDDGDTLSSLLTPGLQALEAIDDLVSAVSSEHDAEREVGQIRRRRARRAGPERRVRGRQQGDRDEMRA